MQRGYIRDAEDKDDILEIQIISESTFFPKGEKAETLVFERAGAYKTAT